MAVLERTREGPRSPSTGGRVAMLGHLQLSTWWLSGGHHQSGGQGQEDELAGPQSLLATSASVILSDYHDLLRMMDSSLLLLSKSHTDSLLADPNSEPTEKGIWANTSPRLGQIYRTQLHGEQQFCGEWQ
jgi:hypothetical protein